MKDLVVKERKTRDEVVKAIESWGHQVLAVVAKQFKDGKHGKAAVLKLVELALFKLLRGQVRDTRVESQVAVLKQIVRKETKLATLIVQTQHAPKRIFSQILT